MRTPFIFTATACVSLIAIAGVSAGPSVDEGRKHWAFQPLNAAGGPAARDAAWVRNDVDRFILAKLEAAGLRLRPKRIARRSSGA